MVTGLHDVLNDIHIHIICRNFVERFSWEDRNWNTISKGVNMTQFDLTSCPNVEPHTSSGWQCGMFAGDVSEQAVLYSSNRAYICSKLSLCFSQLLV